MIEDTQAKHTHNGKFAGLHSHEGGVLHWHDEFGEHTAEELSPEEIAGRELDWKMHNVTLTTIGIDIGSSTTHVMFSRVYIQELGEGAARRFVVVGREILWKSPIILTPYLDDDTIDAEALRRFIGEAFRETGANRGMVDTGAIILTGEALKRKNARAIAELFAPHAGKFVCAAAGHHLEAVLAANGSGTVSRSQRDNQTLLNVDIGGGTTKLALVRDGEILATAAIAIGARLLVRDAEKRLTRIDEPARLVAEHFGVSLALGEPLSPEFESTLVETWTTMLAQIIDGQPLGELASKLLLTDPMPTDIAPEALTFSGGVAEYIFFRETTDFGDLGLPLARSIRKALSNGTIKLPAIIDASLGIRATAIGASLFTSQASTNTFVSNEALLPLRNVPVLVPHVDVATASSEEIATAILHAHERADLEEGENSVALSFRWPPNTPETRVAELAAGIRAGLRRTLVRELPIVVLVDQAVGKLLGQALRPLVTSDIVSLDGVAVSEYDFIDINPLVHPTEVVTISVKSLLFAGGMDRRSVKQALLAAAKSAAGVASATR